MTARRSRCVSLPAWTCFGLPCMVVTVLSCLVVIVGGVDATSASSLDASTCDAKDTKDGTCSSTTTPDDYVYFDDTRNYYENDRQYYEPATDYEHMRHWELLEYFDCTASHEERHEALKIFTPQEFQQAQQVYINVVGQEQSTLAPTGTSMHVPAVVKIVPGKGRGVFTTAPVSRGQLIWGEEELAVFYNARHFRQFLKQTTRDMACGVLEWAWVEPDKRQHHGGVLSINVSLEPGSLMNQADYYLDEEGREQTDNLDNLNAGCVPESAENGDCGGNLYALRDLQADEEILIDYGDFSLPTGWRDFGL